VPRAIPADDVQKSTTTTVKDGRTLAVEMYTRGGVTNLVVKTTSWRDRKGAQRTYTIQQVYHANAVVLEIWNTDDGLGLSTKVGGDVDVGVHCTPDGKLDNVNLMTKDGVTVDHFSVTNGVLSPAPTALIEKANTLFGVGTNDPDEYGRQAQELIEKHKSK
jgi:hypothetical protein